MNELDLKSRPTTQAADGLPRWRWTLEEMDRLVQPGVLSEDDRVELIGGELVPMVPKGPLQDDLKSALHSCLRRHLSDHIEYAVELGWRPDGDSYLEPDILIFERAKRPSRLPAALALLVIEAADSSDTYDLGSRAQTYARLGVREYWTIRAKSRTTRIHRDPGPGGYGETLEFVASDTLASKLIPDVDLRLSGFEIG